MPIKFLVLGGGVFWVLGGGGKCRFIFYGRGDFSEIQDPEKSPCFARQKQKDSPFFFLPWGDPVQNRPQNPAPAGCLFSTRKSRT